MRTSAKLFSLALISLFLMSGCASTEEKVVKTPAEISLAEAIAANKAAKAAGYEWRDTGKLLKYAKKALADGKPDKTILLANKAKRQANIAIKQGAYEDAKFISNLSEKDQLALEDAEAAVEELKQKEMKKAMAAQATAAKDQMSANDEMATTTESAPASQEMTTARSNTGNSEEAYTVVDGDSLWGIAGKASVYADPYQWPLIYKANRSKINDADLIYPGQSFDIDYSATAAEVDAAINHAKTRGAWAIGDAEQSDADYLNQ